MCLVKNVVALPKHPLPSSQYLFSPGGRTRRRERKERKKRTEAAKREAAVNDQGEKEYSEKQSLLLLRSGDILYVFYRATVVIVDWNCFDFRFPVY